MTNFAMMEREYILACPPPSKEKDSHGDFW
jgi:hypothetical protein